MIRAQPKRNKDMVCCKHASWSHVVGSSVPRAAMLRRGRNGRVRHVAWSETRQETDVMATIQTSGWEERDGQTASQVRHWKNNTKQRAPPTVHSLILFVMQQKGCRSSININIKLAIPAVPLNLKCVIENWFNLPFVWQGVVLQFFCLSQTCQRLQNLKVFHPSKRNLRMF